MAQARVTEFFSTRKRNTEHQPSKRRKVDVISTTEAFQITNVNTRSTRSTVNKSKEIAEPQDLKTIDETTAQTPRSRGRKNTKSTKKVKQVKISKGQKTLRDAFDKVESKSRTPSPESGEVITSAWDEHDGPLTPSKRQKESSDGSDSESAITSRKRTRKGKSKENADTLETPLKCEQDAVIKCESQKSRKKLVLKSNSKTPSTPVGKNEYRESLVLPTTPPAISPLPETPEVVRQQMSKGPAVPTSTKVKNAMKRMKELEKEKVKDPVKAKETQAAMKEAIAKCGKLEELKAQLIKIKDIKSQLKKPVPKLQKFDKIEVKVESVPETDVKPASSEKKAPAYERFEHLATPAPPTLTLPFHYKLLGEMFRSMDTVVSMLHNRIEVCTFSKLKAAVQEMTKRNFEKKNVGQIKTVYPTAYSYRQEKGLPSFGNKVSGYELTVEANLDNEAGESSVLNKQGKQSFTAKCLLERRSTFHNKLISIVKRHHKEFLSTLDRPLNVPDDKITRWHPKFRLDQVPEVEVSPLPEPPFVKKYQSAKDVLEDNRGRLPLKVEKALSSVAKTSSETEKNTTPKSTVPSGNTSLPQYQGVPQSLLEKIRAKEAKKLEAAMTVNPEEDKKSQMIRRLPDMMRMLRSHFVTEKKPALTLENVVQKLTDSYKSCIRSSDVEEHVKLMLEVTPEWLKMIEIKKGKYLKMDKNIDLMKLQDKVSNLAKT